MPKRLGRRSPRFLASRWSCSHGANRGKTHESSLNKVMELSEIKIFERCLWRYENHHAQFFRSSPYRWCAPNTNLDAVETVEPIAAYCTQSIPQKNLDLGLSRANSFPTGSRLVPPTTRTESLPFFPGLFLYGDHHPMVGLCSLFTSLGNLGVNESVGAIGPCKTRQKTGYQQHPTTLSCFWQLSELFMEPPKCRKST